MTSFPSSTHAPVRLLLLAPTSLRQVCQTRLGSDARFQLIAAAETLPEFLALLATHTPELLLVTGDLLPDSEALHQVMALHTGLAFVLLPPDQPAAAAPQVPGVRFLAAGQLSFEVAQEEMYQAALRARQQVLLARGGNPVYAHFASSSMEQFLGLKRQAIAVWSAQGGSGKSTLALALALESASRQQPTLLVGLGAPDPLPLVSSLQSEPNLATWYSDPTGEMLKAAVQKRETLDVLAGFPTLASAEAFTADRGALQTLLDQAFGAGYTTIVLDVSHQALAPAAIQAAQEIVLVAQPTLAGVLTAVEAVRVAEREMRLVVNRVQPTSLAPVELFRMGRETLARFPALVTTLVEDPAIQAAEQARQLPYQKSMVLRQGMKLLGDQLWGSAPRSTTASLPGVQPLSALATPAAAAPSQGRVLSLGPVKVRFT